MLPSKGDIVALDAEFVSLGKEETELREDGSVAIVNPSNFALARVSVVKVEEGTGGNEDDGREEDGRDEGKRKEGKEEVFFDYYIVLHEPVFDYLTKFCFVCLFLSFFLFFSFLFFLSFFLFFFCRFSCSCSCTYFMFFFSLDFREFAHKI